MPTGITICPECSTPVPNNNKTAIQIILVIISLGLIAVGAVLTAAEVAKVFVKSFSGFSNDIEGFDFMEFSEKEELDGELFRKVKLKPDGINDEDINFIKENPYPKWEPNNNYLNSTLMSFELAEEYLQTLPMSHKIKCLFYSSRYIGYRIFHLPSFRQILSTWGTNPLMSELQVVSNNLHSLYVVHDPLKDTDMKYWTIYLEVEKMAKTNIPKKKAFYLLSKKYGPASGNFLGVNFVFASRLSGLGKAA